jgi:hypothetical protein
VVQSPVGCKTSRGKACVTKSKPRSGFVASVASGLAMIGLAMIGLAMIGLAMIGLAMIMIGHDWLGHDYDWLCWEE